ncbi:hypothetical protein LV457_06405 [Mycobacterium sp. MYCO198283]|nr:hypothetical protein [Mycobacterium sp. MYCO198283]MCG5431923.1 hypothetical protein [Mycobacterium sp. MYCO198283]
MDSDAARRSATAPMDRVWCRLDSTEILRDDKIGEFANLDIDYREQ